MEFQKFNKIHEHHLEIWKIFTLTSKINQNKNQNKTNYHVHHSLLLIDVFI
jgi:hypothetical protein